MKNLPKLLLASLYIFTICIAANAQTILSPGDAAITGFNSDNTITTKDEFSCVLLVDVDASTVIYFTDNGYDPITGLRTSEGTLTWTATSSLAAGTELLLQDDIGGAGWSANYGTIIEKGSFWLSTSGDQILVYQGNIITPSFITGVHYYGSGWNIAATSSNESALPLGLTNKVDALALKHQDNFEYLCTVSSGTPSEVLAGIMNTSNWLGNNSLTFTLADCGISFPATYYVNASTGDNNNDGSSGSPWATLTYAISQVSSTVADQINVAAGTYSEDDITCSNSVTIVGAGPAATIFDGDGTNRFMNISANDIIIKNCIIKDYQNVSNGGGAIRVTGAYTGIEFENVEFSNNTCPTISSGGGAIDLASSSSTSINRCKFYGNKAVYNSASGGGTRGGAIRGYGTNITLNVYSSLFYENEAGYFGPGILLFGTSSSPNTLNIYNSTFADNNCLYPSSFGAAPVNCFFTTFKVYNTLCYNNMYNDNASVGRDFYNNGGTTYLYNCHVTSSGNYYGINTVVNIAFGDPAFYDSASDDYSLGTTSTCIDGGNNSYWPADGDIYAGEYQSTADIGCFEHCTAAIWDGSDGTDFGTGPNWSTNHPRCNTLTIANVANDPIIGDEAIIVRGSLTINSGASLTVSSDESNASLTVHSDFTNSGTFTHTGTAPLIFAGSSNQNIITGGATLKNVEVSNASGVTLNSQATIGGSLTLTSGNINTNGNILELTGAASDLIGGTSSSFIIATSATGALRRHIGTNTDTYVFPVGLGAASTDYYQMDLENDNLGGMTYLDVFMVRNDGTGSNHSQYGTAYEDGTRLLYFCDEEWSMNPDAEPTSGSFNLTLHLTNLNVGWGGTLQNDKFTIVKRPTASQNFGDYDSFDGSTIIPTAGEDGRTVTSGYAYKQGFTGFSKATVVGSNESLPIELLDFTAVVNEESTVALSWATATEINNNFFTVERSSDGTDFEAVMEVQGAGTSNHIIEYDATDINPRMGINYYRLKQTDFDGSFKYSEMKTVNIFKSNSFSVWPNPAAEMIEISFGESTDLLTTENNLSGIKIYNSIGKLVYKKSTDATSSKLRLDVSSYDEGMYFISLEKNGQVYRTRFLKE